MTSPRGGSSRRVDAVLSGFDGLSDGEQREFIRRLNEYMGSGSALKHQMRKDFTAGRLQLGPTGTSCPLCCR